MLANDIDLDGDLDLVIAGRDDNQEVRIITVDNTDNEIFELRQQLAVIRQFEIL